jgi:hypothetical protein
MVKLLKHIIRNQRGQALPIVLALLVLSGLAVVPSLNYVSTTLDSSRNIQSSVKGLYAADAGIENTLWCLEHEASPDEQLSESINQAGVAIQTETLGEYTLYFGELVQAGVHGDYLSVAGAIEWDGGAGAYKYTITVHWQPGSGSPTIHLEAVGAKLPLGYSYQDGSAADFDENLSTDEPDEVLDASGAWMLNWEFDTPRPSVSESNPVEKQEFFIDGEGELDGHYAWVVATSEDIGEVGEISGALYTITATATDSASGEVTAQIVAEVMVEAGTANVLAWQVTK